MPMAESLEKDLKKAVKILKQFGATEVYLFGSRATGKASPGSDIDLAEKGIPPEKFHAAYAELMFELGHEVHLIDLDESTPFTRYLEAERELRSGG